MTYQEAMQWLESVAKRGGRLGLERMRLLMRELGDPQDYLRFIHIAGTNGKGSVMTWLEHTLVLSGLKVGRYLSPAVFCYEEKIRVNEDYIPKEEVAALCGVLRAASERMCQAGEEAPTIFELETAMALCHFRACACEIVLLETGMGGETDATNIVSNTILEIFSSISLDHMEYLGDTPEKIAAVKAGIIKPGSVAVSDEQSGAVRKVLEERAREKGVPVFFADRNNLSDVTYSLTQQRFTYRSASGYLHENMLIRMAGTWQVENACVALEAVDALRAMGFDLDEKTVRKGFGEAVIEGRFEVVAQKPLIILDGAHNPEAAGKLAQSLRTYFPPEEGRKLYFVMGVFADKDYREEIALTAPLAQRIFTVQTKDNSRALDSGKLAQAVREYNPDVVNAGSVGRGLELALKEAGCEDVIILFGSLSWLREAALSGGLIPATETSKLPTV